MPRERASGWSGSCGVRCGCYIIFSPLLSLSSRQATWLSPILSLSPSSFHQDISKTSSSTSTPPLHPLKRHTHRSVRDARGRGGTADPVLCGDAPCALVSSVSLALPFCMRPPGVWCHSQRRTFPPSGRLSFSSNWILSSVWVGAGVFSPSPPPQPSSSPSQALCSLLRSSSSSSPPSPPTPPSPSSITISPSRFNRNNNNNNVLVIPTRFLSISHLHLTYRPT